MTIIRKLDEAVTIFSVPFNRFGLIPIGGRSTAIKTANGNVVLFASHPNDPETQKALRELGSTVSHLVALDAVHHLYLSDFAKDYPSAKIVGPKGLVSKRKDVQFDIVLPDAPLDAELAKEFQAIHMEGHPNEDIAWYHAPSKTLVQADILFNLPSKDQTGSSFYPEFLARQLTPWSAFHRFVAHMFSKGNPQGYAVAAKKIDDLPLQRIIPCHGEVIEGPRANEAWSALFKKHIESASKNS